MSGDSGNMDEDLGFNTYPMVHIETEFAVIEAIPFFAMPGLQALDIMTTNDPSRTVKMVEFFKLSINDPKTRDVLDILSYRELQIALSEWLVMSHKMEETYAQKDYDRDSEADDSNNSDDGARPQGRFGFGRAERRDDDYPEI